MLDSGIDGLFEFDSDKVPTQELFVEHSYRFSGQKSSFGLDFALKWIPLQLLLKLSFKYKAFKERNI